MATWAAAIVRFMARNGRFALEKTGAVISYGDHADLILATARRGPEAAPSDQVLVVIPRRQAELIRTAGWDALGMRGTCSNTYLLRAEGHAEQILPTPYGDIQNDTMTPFAHLTWSAVWLGIAVDALSRARLYLRKKANATAGLTHLVEANAALQRLKADLTAGLQLYETHLAANQPSPLSLLAVMNNLKLSVSTGVVQIIQQALTICGIAGYRNDSPYAVGRHLRDALSAPLMVSNDRIAGGMGKLLLLQRIETELPGAGGNLLSNLRCELIDAGLLIGTGVDGVVGRGAVFEDVLTRLNAVIVRWEQERGAETVHFPPVMNRMHLERNGYLKSFPQLAAAVHGFTCNDHGQTTGEDLSTGLMLVPAACYPIYPMVADRGKLPPGGALFNIQSWCFRREPSSSDAPRLQSFRMHEYVQLGTAEDVLAARERWIHQARSMVDSLMLPYHIDIANDPFFGRTGRLVASSQRGTEPEV